MSVVFSSTYGIRTFGCYMYCFFVWQLMLYFVGANIIIKGEKTVCQPFQCFMVLLFVCKVKKAENITYHINMLSTMSMK